MISYLSFVEYLNEAIGGYATNPKHIHTWLKANGYTPNTSKKGDHPKYTHDLTGHVATAFNAHSKDVNKNALGRLVRAVRDNHEKNNLKFVPIDHPSLR